MNYLQILDEIKKGTVRPLYLLYGEEGYFIRQIEQAIIKTVLDPDQMDTNLTIFAQDPSVNQLIELIETVPFMGGKNLIILRGTAFFQSRKSGEEDSGEQMDEKLRAVFANMPDYTHVVFSSNDKVDKRRRLYKQMEKYGVSVELACLKAKDVKGWLAVTLSQLQKSMSGEAMDYFVAVTSMMPQVSLGFLTSELEKAALFAGDKKMINRSDVVATMSSLPEVSVFGMVEALSQKKVGKTLHLLEEQLSIGEHPLKIMALLARQVRLLWRAKTMVRQGYGSRDIAEKLGLIPFIAEKTMKQAAGFADDKLKNALLALAQGDYELKTGRGNCVLLEKIIIEMCQ